jgi:hypothetical protein
LHADFSLTSQPSAVTHTNAKVPFHIRPEDRYDLNSTPPGIVCTNEMLGQGRYGEVYSGSYQEKNVAIKKVPLKYLPEDREKIAMINLKHQNLLRLLHVADDPVYR